MSWRDIMKAETKWHNGCITNYYKHGSFFERMTLSDIVLVGWSRWGHLRRSASGGDTAICWNGGNRQALGVVGISKRRVSHGGFRFSRIYSWTMYPLQKMAACDISDLDLPERVRRIVDGIGAPKPTCGNCRQPVLDYEYNDMQKGSFEFYCLTSWHFSISLC
jgi:hypothetical protein